MRKGITNDSTAPLQTDGKKIYLLPAWPREQNVDFKLHAPYKTIL